MRACASGHLATKVYYISGKALLENGITAIHQAKHHSVKKKQFKVEVLTCPLSSKRFEVSPPLSSLLLEHRSR